MAPRTQTQQPPPTGGEGAAYGIVCDGVTQVAATIQYVLDTVPVGTRVVLPAGVALLNQPLTISRSLTLAGAGMNQTTLRQTVPNIPVLTVSAMNVHVTGLTVSHSGTPVSGGDGLIVLGAGGSALNAVTLMDVMATRNWRGFVLGPVAYAQAAHVWADHNNNHGFEFVYEALAGGLMQWDVLHALSQQNLGAGFYGLNTAATNGIGPWITQSLTFANEFGGFSFNGTPGHAISDVRLNNVICSTDNRGGIYLNTYGGSHSIINPGIENAGRSAGFPLGSADTPSVATNTGHGLEVTVNNTYGVMIIGGTYWNNSWSGAHLSGIHSQLIGGQSLGNGLALDPALHRRASVHIGANDVVVSGHTFQHLGGASPGTLHYIHMAGPLTHVEIGHNAYDPALGTTAWIDVSEVTGVLAQLPGMAAGLEVHTGAPQAFGLSLFDATNGPTPRKFLRVAGGQLQILNAATTVIQGLSDVGTPSWPNRRGQTTIADAANTALVTLSPVEPDANYFVQVTPVTATGAPTIGSLTVVGVTKAAGSFTLTVSAAPGAGKSVVYDWFVHR